MPNGFGRRDGTGWGPGGGMGFSFRGASPDWPYIGRGRGGLPRCGYFSSSAGATSPRVANFQGMPAAGGNPAPGSGITKDEELEYLRNQAEAMKEQLENIESRMRDLEDK